MEQKILIKIEDPTHLGDLEIYRNGFIARFKAGDYKKIKERLKNLFLNF